MHRLASRPGSHTPPPMSLPGAPIWVVPIVLQQESTIHTNEIPRSKSVMDHIYYASYYVEHYY